MKLRSEFYYISESPVRIFLQGFEHHMLDGTGDRENTISQAWRWSSDMLHLDLKSRTVKRGLTAEPFVHHYCQGVLITCGQGISSNLFRSHVPGRSSHCSLARTFFRAGGSYACNAKIC